MAKPFFPLLDGVQKPPEPQGEATEGQKSTFFEQFFGTGPSKELGKERARLTDEYLKDKHRFIKGKKKRVEDYDEDMEKRRERYMRRAHLSQFASEAPTKEDLENTTIKHVIKRYNQIEETADKNFDKSETKQLRQLKQDYHHKLRNASKTFRSKGAGAFKNSGGKRQTLGQHFLGIKPAASRRNLAV